MKTKHIIQVTLDTSGIHTVTFQRWNKTQGYVIHNAYYQITYFSYSRLLKTLAKVGYYGLLSTKG